MGDCLKMFTIGKCENSTINEIPGYLPLENPGSVSVRISKTVGYASPNVREDVISIQYALNRVPVTEGGPPIKLVVDGRCGGLTTDAIRKFQLKHFGWGGMDGRVEPEKQSNLKLREFTERVSTAPQATTEGPLDPIADADLIDAVRNGLAEAKNCIVAAQANLLAADPMLEQDDGESSGGLQIFTRAERLSLINRHFEIDKFPAGERRTMFDFINRTYFYMISLITRPGGLWGVQAIQPGVDPDAGLYFSTFAGGFHTPGAPPDLNLPHDTPPERRRDVILVYRGLRDADHRDQAIVHGLIHEMGHFCGPVSGKIINDNFIGPAWFPGGTRATPFNKVHCAESYAYFAREARYGASMYVFPFV